MQLQRVFAEVAAVLQAASIEEKQLALQQAQQSIDQMRQAAEVTRRAADQQYKATMEVLGQQQAAIAAIGKAGQAVKRPPATKQTGTIGQAIQPSPVMAKPGATGQPVSSGAQGVAQAAVLHQSALAAAADKIAAAQRQTFSQLQAHQQDQVNQFLQEVKHVTELIKQQVAAQAEADARITRNV
jgi:hypothetical protein